MRAVSLYEPLFARELEPATLAASVLEELHFGRPALWKKNTTARWGTPKIIGCIFSPQSLKRLEETPGAGR